MVIIDYGMGNLRSVQKKLEQVGARVMVSDDPFIIEKAEKLVLPGVGHFANGVNKLKTMDLWDVLNKRVIEDKVPILGICLGMQLMARHSDEGNGFGLDWFDAEVVRFDIVDKLSFKVPHMGWNNAVVNKESALLSGLSSEAMFYFVHSFHMVCNNQEDILTITEYEYAFTSAIQKGNIYGTQFHPEKSHDWGEAIFKNFVKL